MLHLDQQKKNEYLRNLKNGELSDEALYQMGVLELLTISARHIADNELEEDMPKLAWALEKTVEDCNSVVFEMEQRFDGLSDLLRATNDGDIGTEELYEAWKEICEPESDAA